MSSEEIKTENLRELMRLLWEECKHIESERAWFMNVYAILTGGIMAIVFGSNRFISANGTFWLFLFLIVLTIIGLLLNIRWAQAFMYYQKHIEKTANDLGLELNIEVPAKNIWKAIRTKYLFPCFYILTLAGLLVLAENIILYIISGIVVTGLIVSFYISNKNIINNIINKVIKQKGTIK